jgi:hypothetical protein
MKVKVNQLLFIHPPKVLYLGATRTRAQFSSILSKCPVKIILLSPPLPIQRLVSPFTSTPPERLTFPDDASSSNDQVPHPNHRTRVRYVPREDEEDAPRRVDDDFPHPDLRLPESRSSSDAQSGQKTRTNLKPRPRAPCSSRAAPTGGGGSTRRRRRAARRTVPSRSRRRTWRRSLASRSIAWTWSSFWTDALLMSSRQTSPPSHAGQSLTILNPARTARRARVDRSSPSSSRQAARSCDSGSVPCHRTARHTRNEREAWDPPDFDHD